ncbi:hypothetical protein QBC32DRAFT_314090 [Pseudoneurospora amorphoporcata]|uniref:Uncharacterized protein n=1 Tax=Pseudoneurospora amorphoporcata TaxID=241081 RepID=A0AAN6NWH6_9PEZI|nr:hypothetical protein QBC32DRAFT_314090 [Pseudoneurospora amorphoporcata]
MRSQSLLLLAAAAAAASNPHNLRNMHNRRQPQPQVVTIQTNTDANNGFITTGTTTDANGDPRTLTWFTVPSDGPAATTTVDSAPATATVTTTTRRSTGSGSGQGQATSTAISSAGGARVTGMVGMGAGLLVGVGWVGLAM